MNPTSPQFNEGVRPIPGGSQPTTPSSARAPMFPDFYRVVTPPLPINASKGGAADSKYAKGEQMGGKGGMMETLKPIPRPEPGQGAKVIGTHSMKIGGPKGALGGGGMRGGPLNIGGSGGAFGKIK
ncbi:hypothetical protein UFOVP696_114 [uncultured Caudovirales phage]|jgi:hypothetical protein|uniref:Uncharacterized protein n=1 Tax=uncultured Caudovirales phage TaxID=2100421 RepID=A0A6J5NKQ9_9CAUD|nr:hypothetical protein UFOVP429_53 [uncultured Caudovirales phage]CAB4158246.1 hypothetical protein UFOVP696_114 [uncultured Caudovirales phage]